MISLCCYFSCITFQHQRDRPFLFQQVFINAPIEEAEKRDPKGLYKKARSGALKNFTGIDSPYEAPTSPEIRVNTVEMTPEEAAEHIIRKIMPLK